MKLNEYMRELTRSQKEDLAGRVGTSLNYLFQLSGEFSVPGPKIALRIEHATGGQVTRHELRPDIYPEEGEEK
uniref:HTH cro/C1-type domain-containing protein n=1 Tax=Leptospirillum sp. Group II '5-way CG' TaxID=419541 RepID=B6AS87_9BACT|nr:MAG: Hypothetical protein CGL2_11278001 [Leptospirillum sp. Group II '5-way CG']